MAEETIPVLVFKDGDGNYYAIAAEALQACRVSEEQSAQVAQAVGQFEVRGHGDVSSPLLDLQLLGTLNLDWKVSEPFFKH